MIWRRRPASRPSRRRWRLASSRVEPAQRGDLVARRARAGRARPRPARPSPPRGPATTTAAATARTASSLRPRRSASSASSDVGVALGALVGLVGLVGVLVEPAPASGRLRRPRPPRRRRRRGAPAVPSSDASFSSSSSARPGRRSGPRRPRRRGLGLREIPARSRANAPRGRPRPRPAARRHRPAPPLRPRRPRRREPRDAGARSARGGVAVSVGASTGSAALGGLLGASSRCAASEISSGEPVLAWARRRRGRAALGSGAWNSSAVVAKREPVEVVLVVADAAGSARLGLRRRGQLGQDVERRGALGLLVGSRPRRPARPRPRRPAPGVATAARARRSGGGAARPWRAPASGGAACAGCAAWRGRLGDRLGGASALGAAAPAAAASSALDRHDGARHAAGLLLGRRRPGAAAASGGRLSTADAADGSASARLCDGRRHASTTASAGASLLGAAVTRVARRRRGGAGGASPPARRRRLWWGCSRRSREVLLGTEHRHPHVGGTRSVGRRTRAARRRKVGGRGCCTGRRHRLRGRAGGPDLGPSGWRERRLARTTCWCCELKGPGTVWSPREPRPVSHRGLRTACRSSATARPGVTHTRTRRLWQHLPQEQTGLGPRVPGQAA